MKYMESGGFQGHPLMRLTLSLTLVLLIAFWITNLAIYFSKMGVDPASVVSYYNGSEAEFRPPRTLGSMLEVTHAHLAMMALVVLFLTHLVIFAPFRRETKVLFIVSAFGAALLDEGGGWLVRFVHPSLAVVKVVGFLTLEAVLGFLIVSLAWSLWGRRRSAGETARWKWPESAEARPELPPTRSEHEGDVVVGVSEKTLR